MAAIGHYERVRALVATPRFFVTAGVTAEKSSEVVVFARATNKHQSYFTVPAHVYGLDYLREELILCACADGKVRAHQFNDGKSAWELAAHGGSANALSVARDYETFATVGDDGAVRLWKISDRSKVKEVSLSAQRLRTVAVDPNVEYVAAGGDDGTVYVVTLATGAVRAMSGHAGAVLSLLFNPKDGRLISGGEDGTIRFWYVQGEVDSEVRGQDDTGHVGGVTGLAFVPLWDPAPPGTEVTPRLVSVGMDGKLRAWPLENKRKPKTVELSSKGLYALAQVPARSKDYEAWNDAQHGNGFITAGDLRTVYFVGSQLDGTVDEYSTQFGHAFEVLQQNLSGQPAVREKAINTLAKSEEEEARPLLTSALSSDREPTLRTLVAKLLGDKKARWARGALKDRLEDDAPTVRKTALASLRAIDGDGSLAPLRFALASRHADVRVEAIKLLAVLRDSTPLAEGLIIERLSDAHESVRKCALDELVGLYPSRAIEPLKLGYDRGAEDVVIDSLVRAAQSGLVSDPGFSGIFARALDHQSHASVRRIAFALRVSERKPLLGAIFEGDEDLVRTLDDVARRIAIRAREKASTQDAAQANKPVTKEELEAARQSLPGVGDAKAKPTEQDLEPLLTAMACRTPETALRGARGLARLGDTRALGALLQLSREGDPELRRHAAMALRALEDPRAKKRLVWMLDDADAAVRAAALDAYSKLESSKDLIVAESALRSSHEDVRVRGLDRLVKVGSDAKAREGLAETLLGDALADESEKVRAEAFRTLWAWHDKDPEKALDRALEGRFADLRLRAVNELASKKKDPWALERLLATIGDRDDTVAKAALEAVIEAKGKEDGEAYAKAMESVLPSQRARGADGSKKTKSDALRPQLTKLLQDEHSTVRIAAVDALDALVKDDNGPLYAALQSSFYDLKVRAAEHLAKRKDEQIIEPMRALVLDKELAQRFTKAVVDGWRTRATQALATLGSPRALKLFATELLKDELAGVREAAARGLSVCSRRGDEGFLLDALSHEDVFVRSWAADGLARLGDVRALPVLTGNLRNNHLPIRVGAILSFAALGQEGYGGMLQGLEDADRDVQERVFAIVLARDLQAFRKGEPPELLTSALSSQRPDVRFAAARSLELRTDAEDYLAHAIEVLLPPKPEKAADMKSWPSEEQRGRIMVGLANALASDVAEQRYAAAQVLNLRSKPVEYFVAAQEAAKLKSLANPWVPDNVLPAKQEGDAKPAKGWLRRLFTGDESDAAKPAKVGDKEQAHLLRLAFGAYVGLLRQVISDDEAQRTRRDAVDRIVSLAKHEVVGLSAALPAIVRALDDDNHLVRKAAFAGLKKLYKDEPERALELALSAQSGDVARLALDELAHKGASEWARIARAVNAPAPDVRKYAFELLEKLSPKGSLDPLIAALGSTYADLRLGVIERLAQSADKRVTDALLRALGSEHDDLRLRASELLAERKDARTAEVLSAFLRHDNGSYVHRAGEALVRLPGEACVPVFSLRLDELAVESRGQVLSWLSRVKHELSVDLLSTQLDVDHEGIRNQAFDAALTLAGKDRKKRDRALAWRFLSVGAKSKHPTMRLLSVNELDDVDEAAANELLQGLFGDRDPLVRVASVHRYAERVVKKGASVEPLRDVLKAGTRELVLGASEGVASKGDVLAFRPLLLVVRAGLPEERPRALLALGTLGDVRALSELEVVANGGTEEIPVDSAMKDGAVEALGRLFKKLTDEDAKKRVLDRLEQTLLDGETWELRKAAARALRYVGGEFGRVQLENNLSHQWQAQDVRIECARQLAELGDGLAEPTLARMLHDNNYYIRLAAKEALDKLFEKEPVRVAFLCVDSPHSDVADKAVAFLANEGDAALLVPRLATLNSLPMRSVIRAGIARRGVVPVAESVAVLSGQDPTGRTHVAQLIGTLADKLDASAKKTFAKALTEAVSKADSRWNDNRTRGEEVAAWRQALWAAHRVGATDVLALAKATVQNGDARSPGVVRREALRVLVSAGGEQERAVIEKALLDTDASVRRVAIDVLARKDIAAAAKTALPIEPFDPVTLSRLAVDPALRKSLVKDARGRKVVLAAVINAHEIDELAEMATTSNDNDVRLEACLALGRAGGAKAKEALALVAKDKKGASAELRKKAYAALKRAVRAEKRTAKYSGRPVTTIRGETEAAR
jgi:ParB family chromosome partitioning protein